MATKKDYTELFLTEFRNIETLIRQAYGTDMTFRDLEQKYSESTDTISMSKKMQVCRTIRNYATHNPDINTFLPIPKEACDYLQTLNKKIRAEQSLVKSEMTKFKALTKSDNIAYAAQRLAKISAIPVIDDDNVIQGLFTFDVLRKSVADELSLKTRFSKDIIKLDSLTKDLCVSASFPMSEIDALLNNKYGLLCVTNDGTPKGKYLGILTTY